MAEDNMTLGYLMGQEGNNNGGGFMNSEGLWIIVILAMLGFGNGGFGGGGYGGNGAMKIGRAHV